MTRWAPIEAIGPPSEISDTGVVRQKIDIVDGCVLEDVERPHCVDSAGYHYVVFRAEGQQQKRLIHRLVAEAFVANAHGDPIVHHIDGDKNNNTAGNLEWLTAGALRDKMPPVNKIIPDDDRRSIRARIAGGDRVTDIAAEYGVSVSYISHIGAGRR